MRHWNYRVIKGKDCWYIGEVYYNHRDEPSDYTSAVGLTGDTREELASELALFQEALNQPALRLQMGELVPIADDEED